jgi:hypothetical protein
MQTPEVLDTARPRRVGGRDRRATPAGGDELVA